MSVLPLLLISLAVLVRSAWVLRHRALGARGGTRTDVGTLALRELKATRYTLLRTDSVLRHVWIEAPDPVIAPFRDAVQRERFRRDLQRRVNLWGLVTALACGRSWRRVNLTLRTRAGVVAQVEVSPVDSAMPTSRKVGRRTPDHCGEGT